MSVAVEKCQRVRADSTRFHFHKCGRAVKAEGLCGYCLAGKRKRQVNMERLNSERMSSDAEHKRVEALCTRLALCGVSATASGRYVLCNPEQLLRRLEEVKP